MYFYLHMYENMVFPALIFTKLHTEHHVAFPCTEFHPAPIFMKFIITQYMFISYQISLK